jgi:hypothetical protein
VLALAARILDEPREPSRPDVTASAAFAITAEEKM